MENLPLISVIVPAYNRAPYIVDTLGSILSQNYPNIEIIVIDDGSSDGTYEILKQYDDEAKIKLFTHMDRANRGQSASLNLGLKEAKGSLISILDSDDMFASGKLEEQAEFLHQHPDDGMVYGQGLAEPLFENRWSMSSVF